MLLSNSVLRAVHGELDWCVRNSYSPHHHENIGRCVLHAARCACSAGVQGERYGSVRAPGPDTPPALTPDLADAVTVYPVTKADTFYTLHAYVSRVSDAHTHWPALCLGTAPDVTLCRSTWSGTARR